MRRFETVWGVLVAILIAAAYGWGLYATAYERGQERPRWDDYDIVLDLDDCTVTLYNKSEYDEHTYYFDQSVEDEWLEEGDYDEAEY